MGDFLLGAAAGAVVVTVAVVGLLCWESWHSSKRREAMLAARYTRRPMVDVATRDVL